MWHGSAICIRSAIFSWLSSTAMGPRRQRGDLHEVLARALTEQGLPTTLAQSRRDYQGLLLAEIDSRAQAKLGRS